MKRDWKVVRKILEHVESDDLREYLSRDGFAELHITEEEFLGHIEILADAEIIKNATVRRLAEGTFSVCGLSGVFITMAGHDLLDALRDATVWSRVLDKASRAGVRVSWEFIKAAIPVIMREIVS